MNSAPSSTGAAGLPDRTVQMRPPIRSRASMICVLTPAATKAWAAANPATPAPMIRTSIEFKPDPQRRALPLSTVAENAQKMR